MGVTKIIIIALIAILLIPLLFFFVYLPVEQGIRCGGVDPNHTETSNTEAWHQGSRTLFRITNPPAWGFGVNPNFFILVPSLEILKTEVKGAHGNGDISSEDYNWFKCVVAAI